MSESEHLHWNDDPAPCVDCDVTVAAQKGYRLYTDDGQGPRILCPACYQQRLMRDSGGRTHDVVAEVDGGSG